MVRTRIRHAHVALGTRARFLLVGFVGSLLLFGALITAPSGATASGQAQPSEHASYMVREATVAPTATSPSRSHRLVAPGLFLLATILAAVAAQGMASTRRRTSRRRVEQFHVRRRGPPLLLVTR